MTRTMPWHAAEALIYHNNAACEVGGRIRPRAQEGTGGKRICAECERLNQADMTGRQDRGEPGGTRHGIGPR